LFNIDNIKRKFSIVISSHNCERFTAIGRRGILSGH